jgi:flagellar biosynthesis repressor protein FlbT
VTGLVLKLRPFEKLLVNGAVLQNGPRSTRLRVQTANASVLRLRDAMAPGEASTDADRIYYIAQLVVAGEADSEPAQTELMSLIDSASADALTEPERVAFARARAAAEAGKLYSVMRAMRPLLSPVSAVCKRER